MVSVQLQENSAYPRPANGGIIVIFPDQSYEERKSAARLSGVLSQAELTKISSGEWKAVGLLSEEHLRSVKWEDGRTAVELSQTSWLPPSGTIVIIESKLDLSSEALPSRPSDKI